MPVINHKELEHYLGEHAHGGDAHVFLVFGEELLCKTVRSVLFAVLMPPPLDRSHCLVSFVGVDENIFAAIQEVSTFSLLSLPKIVALQDARLFYTHQDNGALKGNSKEASAREDPPKSGTTADPRKALEEVIEKGFPAGNRLLIISETIDRRQRLYKTIAKYGLVVDCSVPQGGRQSDRRAQADILRDQALQRLAGHAKKMDSSVLQALIDKTGFDPRTFVNNIENLINYVGERKNITAEDVEKVSQRTKLDPIYELTNAVADRNMAKTLFFLDSLLTSGMHPLQMLTAMANQIRKLIVVKGFVEGPQGKAWHSGTTYERFKRQIVPEVQTADKELLKHQPDTDLIMLRNPKNTYPAFQLFLKSGNFFQTDLVSALESISEADRNLKTTGQNPRQILENLIFKICRN